MPFCAPLMMSPGLPLLLLLILIVQQRLALAVDNLNPRPSQFVNEAESQPRFQSPSRSQERLLLIDASADSILLGGRDALYKLSPTTLEPQHTIQWKAPGQTIEECHMKGRAESECHNFIRVAARLQNGRTLLCGTHAFSPQCREYEFSAAEDRFLERGQHSGQAIAPYDPRQNATFVYVPTQNDLFVGAISDFSATDPLIYRKRLAKGDSLRTQKDDRVIDEPNFVGSFAYGDYVYFWYRERAADALDNNREAQFYSRVGRVCANDPGGPSPAQDRWSSFLKARLNCSIPGLASPFYFNEIQAISEPVPDGGSSASSSSDAIVYAVFQTSRALPMSAVCAFRMSQVDAVFDHGRFKTQRTPTSMWTPFQKFYPNAADRPGRCVSDPTKQQRPMGDPMSQVSSKNPLMYEPVQAVGQRPLLVEGPNRADMTSIAAVGQTESVRKQRYNAIFVGRADGTLSKLVETSQNGSAVLVETVRVFAAAPASSPESSAAILGVRVLPGANPPALVAATLTQMVRLPLQHCGQAENCAKCVGLRDPHCAWDLEVHRCVSSRDNWSSGSYVQNVLLGVSEQCPGSTNLLGPEEGAAAYVIDEDVVGGSGRGPWPQQRPGGGNNVLLMAADDPELVSSSGLETMTAGGGQWLNSPGSLSVLVLIVLVATVFGFLIGWRISKWRLLSELARNAAASSGSSTSSNSSDYADGLGVGAGNGSNSARTRLARQDSAENKMMFADSNVYSLGPRSSAGDTVSLVMSQRGAVHQPHHHHLVPLTSISTGASRACSGFATPRHDARYQTASVGQTLPRDYRVRKVYL